MKEPEFAYRIVHHLNHAVDGLDARTAHKLHEARELALARATGVTGRLALAGAGSVSADGVLAGLRSWAAVCLLTIAVAGLAYWNDQQRIAEIEELDTALLADDLPINAYLDNGFEEWLKHSSRP